MSKIYQPRKVYVAASYMAPVGRYNGKEREKLGFLDLAEKVASVFDASPVTKAEIEAVVVGSQNPFAFSGVDNTAAKVAGRLGISGAKSVLIDTASSSGASAFENAYMEIASGRSDHVLAIGIQKMSDVSTLDATRIVAGVIDRDEAEFGLSMPACGALVAGSLMNRLRLSEEEWTAFSALLSERAHRFSSKNPNAHLQNELSVKEYYRQIADGTNYMYWWPLRYHDFCPMSDGVAAVILTALPQDVVVSGVGSATDIPSIADRKYFHSFPATVRAAAQAYGMAGLTDMRVMSGKMHVNMHDPFNGFGPINMIDLGVLPSGSIISGLLSDSLTGPDGEFPTNLTGGLKGRGHPLGATGMIQVVENHQMIREGRFEAGLSHSIGGPINNNVVILLETARHHASRRPEPFRSWGLPALGRIKPKEVTVESLLASDGKMEGAFVAQTTRFDYKSGEPLNTIMIISCGVGEETFRFLFGVPGEHYGHISSLKKGEKVRIERSGADILVDRIPVQRFYQKTLQGIVDRAGAGWKKFRGFAGRDE